VRLELVRPPRLVSVADAGGRRPALLLASRGGRHYVQVSHGAGLNHLRWVPAAALGPPGADPADRGAAEERALPWTRARTAR
jgi:hypothetical protein